MFLEYLFLDPTCWPSLPGTSRRLRTSSMSCGAKFTEALFLGLTDGGKSPGGNHRNMTHIWDFYGIPMGFLKDFYDLPIWDFYEYRIFFSTWDSWLPSLGWIWGWLNLKHVCVHWQWWQPIDWPGENMPPSGPHGFPHFVPWINWIPPSKWYNWNQPYWLHPQFEWMIMIIPIKR